MTREAKSTHIVSAGEAAKMAAAGELFDDEEVRGARPYRKRLHAVTLRLRLLRAAPPAPFCMLVGCSHGYI